MSTLNRLSPGADPGDDGRGQLQETLDVMANRIRLLVKELEQVKDADKIVRPVPVEAFPVAAGQIYTGEEGGEIGDVVWRAKNSAPVGMVACDGSSLDTTIYADLFAAIGYTYGGSGSNFNVPDLKGRTAVGVGTSLTAPGATTWTLGLARGDERTESHDHTMGNHTHNFAHVHGTDYESGGGSNNTPSYNSNGNGTVAFVDNTDDISTDTTGAPSTNTTSSAFNGTDKNVQPSLCLAPFIRFRLGPSDEIQTLPINWGEVNGQWQLDTLTNFPKSAVQNLDLSTGAPIIDNVPEAVVRVSALNGAQSGSTGTSNKIIGVTRIPYNWRAWRPNALAIRTKVSSTGITGGESCTITLRVSDPLSPGSYLSRTFTRTVSESGGSIADTEYVDAVLTAEDLGRTWKPGYMLRFELIFDHPKTFTTAQLDVGLLRINWR